MVIQPHLPKARMKVSVCMLVIDRFSDLQAFEQNLLAAASQPILRASASDTAVVPAYRCGAVPDFHRIPLRLENQAVR